MPNKNWNNQHDGDIKEVEEGAKGQGTVKEIKTTYGNGGSFGSEYSTNGDKIESIGGKGKF